MKINLSTQELSDALDLLERGGMDAAVDYLLPGDERRRLHKASADLRLKLHLIQLEREQFDASGAPRCVAELEIAAR